MSLKPLFRVKVKAITFDGFEFYWLYFVTRQKTLQNRLGSSTPEQKSTSKIKSMRCMEVTPVGGSEWFRFSCLNYNFLGQVYLWHRYRNQKVVNCFHNTKSKSIDFKTMITIWENIYFLAPVSVISFSMYAKHR